MPPQNQQKTIIEPDLTDVLINFKRDVFASLNCHMPGQIQSFNAAKCTATVQPLMKRVLPDGTTQSRPLLIDCPVFFPSGGGARLTFPVAAGDQCIIFYSDRRLDEWMQNGAESVPGDGRMHSMSDAIVAVGLDPTVSFGAVPTDKVKLSYQGSDIEISATGMKLISTGGAEIDLDAKVTIKNAALTLLTAINGLITVIEGLQVNGPIPLTAASIASLEAYKITLATLLS